MDRRYTISGVHLCYVIALAVSAVYVLTTPPSPIGHAGYFTHKQMLGFLRRPASFFQAMSFCNAVGDVLLLSSEWAWDPGLYSRANQKARWRSLQAAMVFSWLTLLVCKKTRLTPAFIVAAVVFSSMFVSNPIERIGYRLYGDATLTGRTGIWAFINQQISYKPWFGWGFHSYYFVPNSPHNAATGYIREMPSSHSGYLELKLETGRIGYWIFLVFIYSSLHLLERSLLAASRCSR